MTFRYLGGSEEGHDKSYYRFANGLCPLRDSAKARLL